MVEVEKERRRSRKRLSTDLDTFSPVAPNWSLCRRPVSEEAVHRAHTQNTLGPPACEIEKKINWHKGAYINKREKRKWE